ncbi:MAG: hypothetical protein A3F43_02105 [Gammaproteobacteria bacterium RIFCSPHIGHO2_12_FULL_42_10]|nr:MAG: hypothetical protein A3F43_02105 [Gammaproteobacteria bacterium RIFCSPHIGHO2_12_FULL_42_10]
MKKHIVLCADDYGQTPAISKGILELVKLGRLSAVSCMVTSPYWQEHAAWLKPFLSTIDIGLHFNLTHEKTPLPQVILQAFCKKLTIEAMKTAWQIQIDAFEKAMGVLPRFIDGHQHVHQLPVIREALLCIYQKRLQQTLPYIRATTLHSKHMGVLRDLKIAVIKAMGTTPFITLLNKHQILYNPTFSGIYSFSTANQYSKHFPAFLTEVGPQGLIMCHPGMLDHTTADPIAKARYLEYLYLKSSYFTTACENQNVIIDRMSSSPLHPGVPSLK